MDRTITGSVGPVGKATNNPDDITTVQELLIQIPLERGGSLPEPDTSDNSTSGTNWDRTLQAIRVFQQFHFNGFSDGKVDVHGQTIRLLNREAKPHAPKSLAFEEFVTGLGFDPLAHPRWQMVPVGDFRIVKVVHKGKAFSLPPVAISPPDKADLSTFGNSVIGLQGKVKGKARVSILGRKHPLATLDVAVKDLRRVPIFFHYLRDGSKGTVRRIGSGAVIAAALNAIYFPQANIFFDLQGEEEMSAVNGVALDLDKPIRIATKGDDTRREAGCPSWNDYIAESRKHGHPATLNIFFAKDFRADNERTDSIGGVTHDVGDPPSLIDDGVTGLTFGALAHEIGHALGCDDDHKATHKSSIMFFEARNGTRILKGDANTMNPS
jgi:hypothetical protein